MVNLNPQSTLLATDQKYVGKETRKGNKVEQSLWSSGQNSLEATKHV
jgi:hypothetical protein